MPPDVRARLELMLAAAEEARSYAAEIASVEDWLANALVRRAVERCLIMVGEQAYNLLKAKRSDRPDLPLEDIATLRHRLVHDYLRIDNTTLYEIVRDSLPKTIVDIRSHLDTTP